MKHRGCVNFLSFTITYIKDLYKRILQKNDIDKGEKHESTTKMDEKNIVSCYCNVGRDLAIANGGKGTA